MARFQCVCWKCGHHWEGDSQPGRGDTCPGCDFDLKVCMNCRFHDAQYRNECRIPETEPVPDRARSNFCGQFEVAPDLESGSSDNRSSEARKRFDDLFGG
jgi:hypothetical protein